MIFEYDIDKKTYSEIYDYGYWSIEGDPAFETFSIIYGNAKSVKDVISNFEKNAQKYTEKYPTGDPLSIQTDAQEQPGKIK